MYCWTIWRKNIFKLSNLNQQDIEDLDHYEMKEEEPVDGKKSEDDGIEKENLAILEKIRKNQRQDHLNVSPIQWSTGLFFQELTGIWVITYFIWHLTQHLFVFDVKS